MKYFGIALILALIPLTMALLSSGPAGRRQVAFVLGALPLFTQTAHMIFAPISWAYWPGYAKGTEVSLIDGIALGVIFALPASRATANYVVPFALLGVFAVLSAFGATAPTAALFVAWQILRVTLIYIAASRLSGDPASMRALIGGMIFGLGCNAAAAVVQHLRGIHQAPGLFGHQNTTGMIAHYVSLPAAALFVADRRTGWALLGTGAAAAVAVLGASRATVGLEAAGLALLIVLVVIFRPNARARALLGIGLAGLIVMAPLAYKALAPRIAEAEATTYDEREAFKNVARDMLHDHPGGIGANHYVIVANVQGYSARNRVAATSGSRSANVHNAYLLTAAEMGWAALVPFVWLSLLTALHALYWSFRSPDKRLAVMLLGCGTAQLVVALHNLFEWVFVTYAVQVLFCLNLGMIAALIGQVRIARAQQSRSRVTREVQAMPIGAVPGYGPAAKAVRLPTARLSRTVAGDSG